MKEETRERSKAENDGIYNISILYVMYHLNQNINLPKYLSITVDQ